MWSSLPHCGPTARSRNRRRYRACSRGGRDNRRRISRCGPVRWLRASNRLAADGGVAEQDDKADAENREGEGEQPAFVWVDARFAFFDLGRIAVVRRGGFVAAVERAGSGDVRREDSGGHYVVDGGLCFGLGSDVLNVLAAQGDALRDHKTERTGGHARHTDDAAMINSGRTDRQDVIDLELRFAGLHGKVHLEDIGLFRFFGGPRQRHSLRALCAYAYLTVRFGRQVEAQG